MKNFLRLILISTLSVFNIPEVFPKENNCGEINNKKNQIYYNDSSCKKESLATKFINNFNQYRDYEEVIKPENQVSDLFGIDGFPEQRLKRSAFLLWETYKKESAKQIGDYRLNGIDINNTFNQSLNDL